MELLHFYFTIAIQLIAVLAAAACLSVYLVSHRKTFLFAFWAFLFYFFDVTLIFQDDFVALTTDLHADSLYMTVRSLASLASGSGVFISAWLLICDFVGEKRKLMLIAPGAVFVLGSLCCLFFIENDALSRFSFYTMRACLLFWSLAFAGAKYFATTDATERTRLRRYRILYAAMWICGAAIVAEDALVFFGRFPIPELIGERNYAEELLMLICAAAACRSAYKTLSLRYENPPTREDERVESAIESNLEVYSKRNKLSKRETEALRLILLGFDNQNIASSMSVAPSTAKVHVHNILQKTGCPSRQDLIQDFWKTW